MALLFFDGFEDNIVGKLEWKYVSLGNILGFHRGIFRTGVAAIQATSANVLVLPSPANVMFTGFALFIANPTYVGTSIWSGLSGGVQHLTLVNDSTGHLVLKRGDANGVVIATSVKTFPPSLFMSVQIKAKISDTDGACIVKVENEEWINFSGDTRNGGSSTAIDEAQYIFYGGSHNNWIVDDLWVCDDIDATATQGRPNNTFMGDLKVMPLLPSGNGDSSQFVGSDGNSIDNYALVDEPLPNTTDYVGSSISGNRDLYNVTDLSPVAASVVALRLGAYVAKSDAGVAGTRLLLKEPGGTVTIEQDETALSTGYKSIWGTQRMTKSDGSLWAISDVNGMQIGAEVI